MNSAPGAVHHPVTVVAHHLPVMSHPEFGSHPALSGLVAALGSLPGVTFDWIGSAATLDPSSPPRRADRFGAVTALEVDEVTERDAIHGMANRTLWPALHGITSRIRERPGYPDAYLRYNRSFATHVVTFAAPGRAVWVHGHQLLMVPQLVKERRPDITIGLSLHTPFNEAAMSALTMSSDLACALSRCDLIGVQNLGDADQLLAFCARSGSRPPVVVSPVSIDPHLLDRHVHSGADRSGNPTGDGSGAEHPLIVGVDRLDYTAGLLERVAAYDLAFDRGDMRPDEVRLVQFARPDRTDSGEDQALRVELERRVHDLNARWPRIDHTPVLDLRLDSVDAMEILDALGRADVAMVTPARDGVTLVAKEFSIVAERSGGVLVLSRTAGAAAELGPDSILVDGASPESVANGLRDALQLDSSTRSVMAQRRAACVRAWTSSDWASSFLTHLASARAAVDTDLHERMTSGFAKEFTAMRISEAP